MGLHGLPNDYSFEEQANLMESEDIHDEFFGADNSFQSPQQFALHHIAQLNSDQKTAFQSISDAVMGKNSQKLFFIEGSGGCGKTYLYNALIRWCLAGKPSSENLVFNNEIVRGSVISAASTGIAALLLIGGGTVHRQFAVPNDVDDETISTIGGHTVKGRNIRNVELIIIDVIFILTFGYRS